MKFQVTVEQIPNPTWVSPAVRNHEIEELVAEWRYKVIAARNVTDPTIGQKLLPSDVQRLIGAETDVIIK